jgi:hypothetical protein
MEIMAVPWCDATVDEKWGKVNDGNGDILVSINEHFANTNTTKMTPPVPPKSPHSNPCWDPDWLRTTPWLQVDVCICYHV